MTYQEIFDYIDIKGKQYFDNNLIFIKDACYYKDDLNYRLLFDLRNCHISIDLEMRSPNMNSIMVWGLEEEIGKISKTNIDIAFEKINNFLNKCMFIRYYVENEPDFGEFYLSSSHEFNESEINHWFNCDENKILWDDLKNKEYKSGKDRVKIIEAKYKYDGVVKKYIKFDDNLFHLK